MDYTAHESSLYEYLSSMSTKPGSSRPFDAIIDCVGDETLYHRSPGYLKPDGRYISIESGPFGYFKLSNWWPVMLGGTPRTRIDIFSKPSGFSARGVLNFFKKGWIKEVPVDSTFEMGDAVKVKFTQNWVYLLLLITSG